MIESNNRSADTKIIFAAIKNTFTQMHVVILLVLGFFVFTSAFLIVYMSNQRVYLMRNLDKLKNQQQILQMNHSKYLLQYWYLRNYSRIYSIASDKLHMHFPRNKDFKEAAVITKPSPKHSWKTT
ncbi:MAG: hypothetical protein COB50_03310 [Thiotrichales bacterium]|nr:MAG: hypothetical protein COB50_03310 [Thiotrichales bacterium]